MGAAVGIILAHADEFAGQSVSLGHVKLSVEEQAQIVQRISGKRCRAEQGPDVPLPDIHNAYQFFNEHEGGLPPSLSSANALLDSACRLARVRWR